MQRGCGSSSRRRCWLNTSVLATNEAHRGSTLIQQFVARGLPRATAYRWLKECRESGRVGQRLAQSIKDLAAARIARSPDDPSANAAAEAAGLLPGPRARELLATCARSDLTLAPDVAQFVSETARRDPLGYAPVTIVRREETGLGDWLVVVPSDFARPLYEVLRQAGAPLGAVDIGVRAWDALRLEHGTPIAGLDIDRIDDPVGGRVGSVRSRRAIGTGP